MIFMDGSEPPETWESNAQTGLRAAPEKCGKLPERRLLAFA